QAAVLESLVDDELQLLHEIFRLQDVVEGAHFQRLDSGLGAGKSGEQDELVVEPAGSEFTQEIDARHICHFDVGDNEIEIRGLDLVEAFESARNAFHLEAFLLEENFEQLANRPLIIDDKYFGSFGHL